MGQNRNVRQRNNARRPQTFQGGLSVNQGMPDQAPVQAPTQAPGQGRQQCPPGQEPARDPRTGAQTCKQVQPNVSGNVPVKNADRAIAPKPGKPTGY
jgi:hypothetical protein